MENTHIFYDDYVLLDNLWEIPKVRHILDTVVFFYQKKKKVCHGDEISRKMMLMINNVSGFRG